LNSVLPQPKSQSALNLRRFEPGINPEKIKKLIKQERKTDKQNKQRNNYVGKGLAP
jgi:hypothetical protein